MADAPLKRGWTTGACATAATKSALHALFSGEFLDPVEITLPRGEQPNFCLAFEGHIPQKSASAGIIKDAGDDPDVTHGALIISNVYKLPKGAGIQFKAGIGVGTVTLDGLPIPKGQAAINPKPREMMTQVIEEICNKFNQDADIMVEISIPNGEEIAKKTWNPRLGILGGLSILGTTGIVHPFSCSAWIASIHRGVDVALKSGFQHIAGSTGSMSENAVKDFHNMFDIALMDMGDFVGGLLKYARGKKLDQITISGGFAKMCKLAQGSMDLHSGRSQVDFNWLANCFKELGAEEAILDQVKNANTALFCLNLAKENQIDIARLVAKKAQLAAIKILRDDKIKVDILISDREGNILAHCDVQNHILILGGTKDARQLANILSDQQNIHYSILGNTDNPKLPKNCLIRRGGFGGIEGLANYINEEKIDLVIDATHPFAAQISNNARHACEISNRHLFTFNRRRWQADDQDDWGYFDDFSELTDPLSNHQNIFLALGNQAYQDFLKNVPLSGQQKIYARMVMRPFMADLSHEIDIVRPPFKLEDELAKLQKLKTDAIVLKNSGGKKLSPLLLAARQLGIKCYLLNRPEYEEIPYLQITSFDNIENLAAAVNLYKE